MLYLGIDQHRKQITISLRDEAGTGGSQTASQHGVESVAVVSRIGPRCSCVRRRILGRHRNLRVQRLVDQGTRRHLSPAWETARTKGLHLSRSIIHIPPCSF